MTNNPQNFNMLNNNFSYYLKSRIRKGKTERRGSQWQRLDQELGVRNLFWVLHFGSRDANTFLGRLVGSRSKSGTVGH